MVCEVYSMLILPIVNKNRILNVQITLKNAEKIRKRVSFPDAEESEIIVNGKKLSESIYKNSKEDKAALNFIRFNTLHYPRNYLITTKQERDSQFYDVYEVAPPPKKVSEELDNLYGRVLTDMRKEVPGTNKGRYLSFEKVGLDKNLTDDKIMKLQQIVREERDTTKWPTLFEMAGVADLTATIHFIQNFDCTVVADTTIPENSLNDTLKALEVIRTRDSKNLRNYYTMAQKNRDIYAKLSYISKLVYNRPLNLIKSNKQKQKQLIKYKEQLNIQNAG